MLSVWSSEVNKAVLEQVKATEYDCDYMLQKKNYVQKISSINSNYIYISFTSKFIWNHLYLFIICIIYLESSTKVFSGA